MHIVLIEPEIPGNTGNIVRLCAATGFSLHLVRPLGFEVSDKYLKRAGLDYWHLVDISYHDSFAEVREKYSENKFWFLSTKAPRSYSEAAYKPDDFIVFGKETKGIDEKILRENYESCVRIPMREGARSLNLANSVAVVSYEALRQQNFAGLLTAGKLTGEADG